MSFELSLCEILKFKWILSLKININYRKQVLEEKSVENHVRTWKSTVQFKYDF
jgi:hypothetical protein